MGPTFRNFSRLFNPSGGMLMQRFTRHFRGSTEMGINQANETAARIMVENGLDGAMESAITTLANTDIRSLVLAANKGKKKVTPEMLESFMTNPKNNRKLQETIKGTLKRVDRTDLNANKILMSHTSTVN